MDDKYEKVVSKVAKLPSLSPLALKSEFFLQFQFLENYKHLYGKCCWWVRSAHQQYFPYKSFKFSKNSSCHQNSLCNVRRLELGHFRIFDMLFSFLASVLHHDRFWWLTRSRDHVLQRAYVPSNCRRVSEEVKPGPSALPRRQTYRQTLSDHGTLFSVLIAYSWKGLPVLFFNHWINKMARTGVVSKVEKAVAFSFC